MGAELLREVNMDDCPEQLPSAADNSADGQNNPQTLEQRPSSSPALLVPCGGDENRLCVSKMYDRILAESEAASAAASAVGAPPVPPPVRLDLAPPQSAAAQSPLRLSENDPGPVPELQLRAMIQRRSTVPDLPSRAERLGRLHGLAVGAPPAAERRGSLPLPFQAVSPSPPLSLRAAPSDPSVSQRLPFQRRITLHAPASELERPERHQLLGSGISPPHTPSSLPSRPSPLGLRSASSSSRPSSPRLRSSPPLSRPDRSGVLRCVSTPMSVHLASVPRHLPSDSMGGGSPKFAVVGGTGGDGAEKEDNPFSAASLGTDLDVYMHQEEEAVPRHDGNREVLRHPNTIS